MLTLAHLLLGTALTTPTAPHPAVEAQTVLREGSTVAQAPRAGTPAAAPPAAAPPANPFELDRVRSVAATGRLPRASASELVDPFAEDARPRAKGFAAGSTTAADPFEGARPDRRPSHSSPDLADPFQE